MEVEWIVVIPAVDRADRMPTRSDETTFLRQLDLILGQAAGYLEVAPVDSAYPLVTLSIGDELAVVHRLVDESTCLLLQGDRRIDSEDFHDFLVLDDLVAFTGEFISSAARAAEVLRAFAHGSDLDSLGRWERL